MKIPAAMVRTARLQAMSQMVSKSMPIFLVNLLVEGSLT